MAIDVEHIINCLLRDCCISISVTGGFMFVLPCEGI